jgi:hypothetical protein
MTVLLHAELALQYFISIIFIALISIIHNECLYSQFPMVFHAECRLFLFCGPVLIIFLTRFTDVYAKYRIRRNAYSIREPPLALLYQGSWASQDSAPAIYYDAVP